jgi:archaellin
MPLISLSGALASTLVYAQEQTQLETVTDKGTFDIKIIWTSSSIGSENVFEIYFFDPDTGSEIEDMKYDISIYRDNTVDIQRLDQVSNSQKFFFEDVGSYVIRIDDIDDLGEGATVPIQVTPEFGANVFIPSTLALGIVVLAALANGNNLFRPKINSS